MFINTEELRTHLRQESIAAITRNDPTMAVAAIEGAVVEAKGYLSRYDVEAVFAAQGEDRNQLLLIFVKDIATWHLVNLVNPNADFKVRKERYDRAVEWLKAVQKGDVVPDLPLATGQEPGHTRWGSAPKQNNDW